MKLIHFLKGLMLMTPFGIAAHPGHDADAGAGGLAAAGYWLMPAVICLLLLLLMIIGRLRGDEDDR
jgi:hypothetical protein